MTRKPAANAALPLPNGWQLDQARQAMASKFFTTGNGDGVPKSNPQNFESFLERPNPVAPGYSGNEFVRANPYGDAMQAAVLDTPQLTRPVPAAARVMAPSPAPGAEQQVNTPGYGFNPQQSPLNRIDVAAYQNVPPPLGSGGPAQPLGMSTGVSLAGSGPQRNVPPPQAT